MKTTFALQSAIQPVSDKNPRFLQYTDSLGLPTVVLTIGESSGVVVHTEGEHYQVGFVFPDGSLPWTSFANWKPVTEPFTISVTP